MQLRIELAVLVLALLLSSGCGDGGNVTPVYFGEELRAALAIEDPLQRDAALVSVARSASGGADGETVVRALGAINNPLMKDETAADVAPKLSAAGKAAHAIAVARRIANPLTRDKVLATLSNQ